MFTDTTMCNLYHLTATIEWCNVLVRRTGWLKYLTANVELCKHIINFKSQFVMLCYVSGFMFVLFVFLFSFSFRHHLQACVEYFIFASLIVDILCMYISLCLYVSFTNSIKLWLISKAVQFDLFQVRAATKCRLVIAGYCIQTNKAEVMVSASNGTTPNHLTIFHGYKLHCTLL